MFGPLSKKPTSDPLAQRPANICGVSGAVGVATHVIGGADAEHRVKVDDGC